MWKLRWYRRGKRLLLPLASLPLFQMTGTCDGNSLIGTFMSQLNGAVFNTFVGSVRGTLLQNFPSADILQFLLGNPPPLFTG